MNVYLIRHADAGDPRLWAGDDAERPLSELGHRQARALGETFRRLGWAVGAVASSPLVRARQTAEGFLAGGPAEAGYHESVWLAPGSLRKRKLTRDLAALGAEDVAVVGHDPDLPAYLAWLVEADPENVRLEKGGAALVTFDGEPEKGAGRLAWVVTPDWYLGSEQSSVTSDQ
ncbi:MAG: histidine phosphatase family protein [Gemmataceae bacterium]|nr:histidine phosphatase family protein [Gemmataceae bacterium]